MQRFGRDRGAFEIGVHHGALLPQGAPQSSLRMERPGFIAHSCFGMMVRCDFDEPGTTGNGFGLPRSDEVKRLGVSGQLAR